MILSWKTSFEKNEELVWPMYFFTKKIWKFGFSGIYGQFVMANLMSIFLKFFMKLKFWQFSEKQISRKIERNLTVRPIELIGTVIEVLTPSLYPEHINNEKVFRKLFTKNEGGYP